MESFCEVSLASHFRTPEGIARRVTGVWNINLEHDTDKVEGVSNLLYVKIEDDILSDNSMVESQNIERQQTSDVESVPEH